MPDPTDDISVVEWDRMESRFRLWSFQLYYDLCYADEKDPTLRFAKAIVASAQPILDRAKVIEWYRSKQWQRPRKARMRREPDEQVEHAVA